MWYTTATGKDEVLISAETQESRKIHIAESLPFPTPLESSVTNI